MEKSVMPNEQDTALKVENLSLWYGEKQALKSIDLRLPTNSITDLIGPSG